MSYPNASNHDFVNALRAFVYGQAPIPETARDPSRPHSKADRRFLQHWSPCQGSGNYQRTVRTGGQRGELR
jgi:hypothetical protein